MSSVNTAWRNATAKERNQMLLDAGIKYRTLTLYRFEDLPLDIKIDLIYSYDMRTAPVARSLENSHCATGDGATADEYQRYSQTLLKAYQNRMCEACD